MSSRVTAWLQLEIAARPKGVIMGRLNSRVAIVTGGSRGIGRHYCEALAREGARVAILDVASDDGLSSGIDNAAGAGTALYLAVDVSDEKQVIEATGTVKDQFGRIDILVNNAALFATLESQAVTDIDVQLWDKVMRVNLRGPFLMVKHVAPHMVSARYGKIVNIASALAYRGLPGMLHYVTSKGGILSFTRTLSRELGIHRICVNSLAPGLVLSDSIAANEVHVGANRDHVLAARALKSDVYPRDLLGALIFLCSEDSDFITGQTLVVDGGTINT